MKKHVLFIFMIFSTLAANAQESEKEKEKEDKYRHRITVMMANSHIPNMESIEGQNKFSIVPTWGLDYDFWFNKKWAIGLHNDLVLQQYKIIKAEDHTEVE